MLPESNDRGSTDQKDARVLIPGSSIDLSRVHARRLRNSPGAMLPASADEV